MINITVAAGSGSVSIDFGHVNGEAVSLISPDNTPLYDFNVYNAAGAFVIGANGIDAQKTKINEPFQLDGLCSLNITNAADDGTYQVHLFTK